MSDISFPEREGMSHNYFDIVKNGLRVGGITQDHFSEVYTAYFIGGYSSVAFRFTASELQEIAKKIKELK